VTRESAIQRVTNVRPIRGTSLETRTDAREGAIRRLPRGNAGSAWKSADGERRGITNRDGTPAR